jgi:hypothetical protein
MNELCRMVPTTGPWTFLGLAACSLFGGCGGSEDNGKSSSNGGTAGSTSSLPGAGGTTAGGAGGASGATAGGAVGTTAGGAVGTTAGGASGTAGSTCGPRCTAVSTCTPNVFPSGLTTLTDFASNLDAQGNFHTGGVDNWTSLFGGTWVAPKADDPCATQANYPLTQDLTAGNWHITGTIGNQWAGAGLWFSGDCGVMDLSAYQGLSFTIAGSAGPSGSISVSIATSSNSALNTDTTSSAFTCYSNAATCTATTCTGASLTVSHISSTPQTVTLLWADLANGAPNPTPNRAEITGFGFNPTIDWSGTAAPYALDLIIDDLALIP